ncbi:MAG: DUF1456 family protein [Bacillota bacterium]
MENNDILIRLRYALDIKDTDLVKMFSLGECPLSKEEIKERLTKNADDPFDEFPVKCSYKELESFLNGFIIFKRGVNENAPQTPILTMTGHKNINNIMLKKVKIALSLTSEEMLEIFAFAGLSVSKSELSALFRREDHKHYKECKDKFARNFLKGLAVKYRK